MSSILVFGGSSGLGQEVSDHLTHSGHIVHTASRSAQAGSPYSSQVDLQQLTCDNLDKLFDKCGIPDAICFSQRYRPGTSEYSAINEYQVSVASVAQILDYLLQNLCVTPEYPVKVVIVGSTYSTRVGRDQGWSYHAVKHAQLALTKYYALNSMGCLNTYHVSPPTFVKSGALEYWKKTQKYQKWLQYPPKTMLSVESISNFIVELLINGSPLLSGSDLRLDHGVSELYNDQ